MSDTVKRLKVGEAAKHYGVHRTTVYRWMLEGKVEVETVPSGRHRVVIRDAEDTQAWIAKLRSSGSVVGK